MFSRPDFTPLTPDDQVYALNWKTSRYQNKIGSWQCEIPVDNGLIEGVPLHRQLHRGWHINLSQENNNPYEDIFNEFLMHQGVVLQKDYISEGGGTFLRLSGSFRGLHLTDRSTLTGLSYSGQTGAQIGEDLVDGDNIIGPNGGLIAPVGGATPVVRFNDITRFEALIKTAELARYAYRESWDHDRPEFTKIDNPPDSGITLQKVPFYDPISGDAAATNGIGIIADPPSFRFDGAGVVNRIIAIGSDTPDRSSIIRNYYLDAGYGDPQEDGADDIQEYLEGSPNYADNTALTPAQIATIIATYGQPNLDPPLTLGSASTNAPYPVQTGVNPDGSDYYYIEDTDSIERYGLVETTLVRTDVKNPSANAGTREAAANVLYAIAAGMLLKHKSEIMVVDVPVANGVNIWALPGDKIRLTYAGEVLTPAGTVTWMDEDRYFMVSERHDSSTPSGVRDVRFVLQAPEIQMVIPDLPDAIILPPQDTSGFGGGDGGDFPQSSDCCDDPTADISDGAASPPPVIFHTPEPRYPVIWLTSAADVDFAHPGFVNMTHTVFLAGDPELTDGLNVVASIAGIYVIQWQYEVNGRNMLDGPNVIYGKISGGGQEAEASDILDDEPGAKVTGALQLVVHLNAGQSVLTQVHNDTPTAAIFTYLKTANHPRVFAACTDPD